MTEYTYQSAVKTDWLADDEKARVRKLVAGPLCSALQARFEGTDWRIGSLAFDGYTWVTLRFYSRLQLDITPDMNGFLAGFLAAHDIPLI